MVLTVALALHIDRSRCENERRPLSLAADGQLSDRVDRLDHDCGLQGRVFLLVEQLLYTRLC